MNYENNNDDTNDTTHTDMMNDWRLKSLYIDTEHFCAAKTDDEINIASINMEINSINKTNTIVMYEKNEMNKELLQNQIGLFFKQDFQGSFEEVSLSLKKVLGSDAGTQILNLPPNTSVLSEPADNTNSKISSFVFIVLIFIIFN